MRGTITAASERKIQSIDGAPAAGVYAEWTGSATVPPAKPRHGRRVHTVHGGRNSVSDIPRCKDTVSDPTDDTTQTLPVIYYSVIQYLRKHCGIYLLVLKHD